MGTTRDNHSAVLIVLIVLTVLLFPFQHECSRSFGFA